MDITYQDARFDISEIEHRYGPNIHIMKDPLAWTYLARLGHPSTVQPEFTEMIRILYRHLLHVVISQEFPQTTASYDSRMKSSVPSATWVGSVVDPATKVVCVDIARAGMIPSQVCFEVLHSVLPNDRLRQDHIVMNRAVDEHQRVTGAQLFGQKIGGDIDGRVLLFPDPMGATGSSICRTIDTYLTAGLGTPSQIIALHLMVTPEYVQFVKEKHPNLKVYAFRLDRGMSTEEALSAVPGTHPDQESGLNEVQYIIPGGGGFGELLNNAES